MNIAFFDFDGTITTNDSLLRFTRFAKGDIRFIIGLFMLSPILIAYKFKFISNHKAKEKTLSWFFKGEQSHEFLRLTSEYSLNHIDKIVRQVAMDRIEWHKQQGDKVVVVSASLECWLKPWCDKNSLDLISTKLKIENNIVCGEFLTKNCHGKEKAERIKNKYDLSKFDKIYAYGDSDGDKEMLALADMKFYKYFQ